MKTVEEARAAIVEMIRERQAIIHSEFSCGNESECAADTRLEADTALDDLIRAVRAEMPCYLKQQGVYDCTTWNSLDDGTLPLNEQFRRVDPCPSCKAREGG